jgi:hypothetical protein
VVPQQALALANSRLVIEQSRKLAETLADPAACDCDPNAFVRAAFLRILARPATDAERAECATFLAESPLPAARARQDLLTVLFNHNDFVTVR